jgi:hypothetical protein
VCAREGLATRRVPTDHAGGKWRLTFVGMKGSPGTLELDVNFMLRTPLWPCVMRNLHAVGSVGAASVRMLDLHEMMAGKLAALLARSASRDLFDARALLVSPNLDPGRLRLAFVVYGGISRKDWRTVSADDVTADANEVQTALVPMLRADRAPAKRDVAAWARKLVAECRERLARALPLNDQEMEFLRRLNDEGEIAPELLTTDPAMQVTVREHPALKWKVLNVHHRRPASAVRMQSPVWSPARAALGLNTSSSPECTHAPAHLHTDTKSQRPIDASCHSDGLRLNGCLLAPPATAAEPTSPGSSRRCANGWSHRGVRNVGRGTCFLQHVTLCHRRPTTTVGCTTAGPRSPNGHSTAKTSGAARDQLSRSRGGPIRTPDRQR